MVVFISELPINGTLIWYSVVCKREVWLMSRQLTPDENYESVVQGRTIHEQHYTRGKKELSIENSKIDMMQRKDGSILVTEIKKSSRFIEPSILQLKYYLSLFHEKGVEAIGLLRFPTEKKQIEVNLTNDDISILEEVKSNILDIVRLETPPKPIRITFCKSCAYSEYCWS
ncbi:MAG: CRISPR-associated protein Cas4 [Thermoplasmatales archaeon]